MRTFKEAKDMYENTRKRKLANNIYLVKTETGYGIQLYNTIIVEYVDEHRTRLNTGGWRTHTTYKRMGQFINFNTFDLGFKRRSDIPDNVIVDDRDLFIEFPRGLKCVG